MQIEATPRDAAAILDLLPDQEADPEEHPRERVSRLLDKEVPGPEGATLRFEGMTEFRAVDVGPILEFVLLATATATGDVIAAWIIGRFRGRVTRLSINRRQVDLDGEGQVRRIVDEEIRLRRE